MLYLEITFIHFYSYGKGYSRSGLCIVSGCMNDTWLSIYYWACFFFICTKDYRGYFLHKRSNFQLDARFYWLTGPVLSLSWVDIFRLFSFKMGFAFVLAVLRMNARLFNGHRLEFSLVKQLLEIRSKNNIRC